MNTKLLEVLTTPSIYQNLSTRMVQALMMQHVGIVSVLVEMIFDTQCWSVPPLAVLATRWDGQWVGYPVIHFYVYWYLDNYYVVVFYCDLIRFEQRCEPIITELTNEYKWAVWEAG